MNQPLDYARSQPRFSRLVFVALVLAGLSFLLSILAAVPAWIAAGVAIHRIKNGPWNMPDWVMPIWPSG